MAQAIRSGPTAGPCWLSGDALRPWRHRSWIFPRDPNFADKAGPILDLYERVWEGAPLSADDYVISADEKTSIQARRRKQPTLPAARKRPTRVEHEYFRQGAWTYLAAWDVHRAKVFGRCEVKSGIAPVDRLVGEVMSQEPYKSARRVFWIMDNCSAHRGQKAVKRLRDKWPNATVHKLRMPEMLRKSLSSTNIIESAFSVAEELCRRVKRWREGDHRERWAGSALLLAASKFRRVKGSKEIPKFLTTLLEYGKKGLASKAKTA